jgi:hypothetical protein
MRAYPISQRVNSRENDDPAIIAPLAAAMPERLARERAEML